MKYFIFALFFILISCEQNTENLKRDFSESACEIYHACDFSPVAESFCIDFASFSFDQIPPEKQIICSDCLINLGCKMWVDSSKCNDCF